MFVGCRNIWSRRWRYNRLLQGTVGRGSVRALALLAVGVWLSGLQASCSTSPSDDVAVDDENYLGGNDCADADGAEEVGHPDVDLLEGPVAVIECVEGANVVPQTVLHLSGAGSHSGAGAIVGWKWSVEQPPGSRSVFVPSDTSPEPTFEANVAGVYTFSLLVFDETDNRSPSFATMVVVVKPDTVLHIELLWHTPDDQDETDSGAQAGSDLDLHFTHPWAEGHDVDGDGALDGFFDNPFDCYWFNGHPEWGDSESAFDNPSLDRDDTDGAGPENLNLAAPEPVTYRVGVHYWNDHDYGVSYATLKVYLHGELALEVADVSLSNDDMWDACTIEFPNGHIQMVADENGSHKVIPDYSASL